MSEQEEYLRSVLNFYHHEFRLITAHLEGLLTVLEIDERERYTFQRSIVDLLDHPHLGQQAKAQLLVIYRQGEPQRIEDRSRHIQMLQAELQIFNEIMQKHVDKLQTDLDEGQDPFSTTL